MFKVFLFPIHEHINTCLCTFPHWHLVDCSFPCSLACLREVPGMAEDIPTYPSFCGWEQKWETHQYIFLHSEHSGASPTHVPQGGSGVWRGFRSLSHLIGRHRVTFLSGSARVQTVSRDAKRPCCTLERTVGWS